MRLFDFKIYTFLFIFLAMFSIRSFAWVDPIGGDADPTPDEGGGGISVNASGDPPSLGEIVTPIGNIINIAIMFAGVVFVIFLAYGAIKASLSMGDPRGLEGAQQTWTSALIGLFIVVGVWVILRIVVGFFGGSVPSAQSLLGKIQDGINEFMTGAGVR